jgi:type VI secretion system protein ImpJ
VSTLHKVLWQEGMFLTPQHFQQADRYHQEQLSQVTRALSGHAHGVLHLDFDLQALAAGDVALTAGEGIFPDGTPFRFADPNELPPARPAAEHIADGEQRTAVWLGLPLTPPGAVACAPDGRHEGRHTRFRNRTASAIDDTPGGRAREIGLAAPNLRLLFGDESRDGHTCLRLAEIVRTGSGAFALAEDHVPPCLRLGAYPALLAVVRRITEILVGRSTELALSRRSRTQGMVEFSVSEAAAFLTLHTLNGSLPGLLHVLHTGHQHPEQVFLALATLAAQLMTLTDDGHPKDLPRYQHEDPAASFSALEARLRALLEVVTPQRYVPVLLSAVSDRVHAGTIPEGALDGARMYLAVVSNLPAERAMRDIPTKTKVASSGRIAALTTQAMPGIRLIYLAVPPPEIPAQPGGTYFELDRASPEWAIAQKTRSLAIYLPPDLIDARAEFLAVKE